jgi:transcriptional antiterminator RfaH
MSSFEATLADDRGHADGQAPSVRKRRHRTLRQRRGYLPGGPRPRIRIPFWTVVRTKGGSERLAVKRVREQGLQAFQALMIKRGFKNRTENMFPGYIFVQINPAGGWGGLRSTPGVLALLMTNGKFDRVRTEFVESLLSSMDEDGIIELPERRKLIPGEQVRVEQGAFQGRVGVYDGALASDRIRLLFSFMGQDVDYEIERHKVVPVNA